MRQRSICSIKIADCTHYVKASSIVINKQILTAFNNLTCTGNGYIMFQSPNTRTYRYGRTCFGLVVIFIFREGSRDGISTFRLASGKLACFAIKGEVASGFYRISDCTLVGITSTRYSQSQIFSCIESFEHVDAYICRHTQLHFLLCSCWLVGNLYRFYSRVHVGCFECNGRC